MTLKRTRLAPLDCSTNQICPKCCVRYVVYNGNYMCEGWEYREGQDDEGCKWAMRENDNSEFFIACYSDLMRNRGQEPDQKVIDETRRMDRYGM